MLLVLFFCLGKYENVINKVHDKLIQIFHKYLIHEIHEIGWGVCQSKRHHGILIESIPGAKCGLWNIRLSDFQLMVSDLKSIFEKTLAPYIWSNRSSILGRGYLFLMVTSFSER
jgi:hypothetical protein